MEQTISQFPFQPFLVLFPFVFLNNYDVSEILFFFAFFFAFKVVPILMSNCNGFYVCFFAMFLFEQNK